MGPSRTQRTPSLQRDCPEIPQKSTCVSIMSADRFENWPQARVGVGYGRAEKNDDSMMGYWVQGRPNIERRCWPTGPASSASLVSVPAENPLFGLVTKNATHPGPGYAPEQFVPLCFLHYTVIHHYHSDQTCFYYEVLPVLLLASLYSCYRCFCYGLRRRQGRPSIVGPPFLQEPFRCFLSFLQLRSDF